jgi:predicted SAM-dependent methyltransferase
MGQEPSAGSQRDDSQGAEVHRKVFAKNSGKCVEEDTGFCVNVGCGKVRWPNWLNIDFEGSELDCDIRKLPIDDNHCDAVAAIHVIEHFYQWEVVDVLKEWHRVLKPGGRLILELPCLDKILKYIQLSMNANKPMTHTMTFHALYGDPKYKAVPMCHKWAYTHRQLIDLLNEAGFQHVSLEEANYHFPERDMRLVAVK